MPWRAVAEGVMARHSKHTAAYPERSALADRAQLCARALVCQHGQSRSRAARVLTVDGRAEETARLSEPRVADVSWAVAHTPSRVHRARTGAACGERARREVAAGPCACAAGLALLRKIFVCTLWSRFHLQCQTLTPLGWVHK